MNKQLIYNILIFAILIISIIFNSSCSSNKKATKTSLSTYTVNNIIREVEKNQFDFENLQAKINIRFKDDKNALGLRGQVRIQKDSVVWISLSLKVGIEVGRMMITTDSIKFIDRNNRSYISESLNTFADILPIEPSVSFIQDLLIGNDTQIQKGGKYKISTEDDKYKLEVTKKEKKNIKNIEEPHILVKDMWIIPENFRISRYNIKEYDDDVRKIQLEYNDFKLFNNKYLPTKINITLSSGYDMSLEIEYNNIEIDEKISFPFNVSDKFERIFIW